MSMLTIDLRIVTDTPISLSVGNPEASETTTSDRDISLSPFVRDLRGKACIPASTLKGLHRAATEQIVAAFGLKVCHAPHSAQMCHPINGMNGEPPCLVCQIFGSPWVQGRVFYRDLTTLVTPEVVNVTRSMQSRRRRIKLGSDTKAYDTLPAGTIFSGTMQHLIGDKAQLGLAVAALRSIRMIGAGRSAGIGLCRVEAHALDSLRHPVSERELAEALQTLRQNKQPRNP